MSGPVKARDVRAAIREHGFERGVERILTLLCDELVGYRQAMNEMATIQSQTIDRLSELTTIGGTLAQRLSDLKRSEAQFDGVRGEGIKEND